MLGEIERGSFWDPCCAAYEVYRDIHDALCREYGIFALGEEKNFFQRVGNFLLNEKECLNECLKAFESCLKTICKKRGWPYDDKKATAKDLIQIVFDNGLIPSFSPAFDHYTG